MATPGELGGSPLEKSTVDGRKVLLVPNEADGVRTAQGRSEDGDGGDPWIQ